jgi:hypothetical protein
MLLERKLLPAEQRDWHGFLRDYFCDKDAIATAHGDQIQLRLEWPSGADRHVDPELQNGLRWWGGDVTLSSMWSTFSRDGKILTALYDTWTLHSWSQWLARTESKSTKNVVILHVDDHRDLGAPRLLKMGGSFIDAISGKDVNLRDPDSVFLAIESGAIGMGSFMTPFIHEVPTTCVHHLCQPPKNHRTIELRLQRTGLIDTLLHVGAERPAIELAPIEASVSGNYLCTSDVLRWAEGIEGRSALVHIDMDYFNNRFDGDSAWQERHDRLDPCLPVILEKIDELVDALASSKSVIEDVTIAYSPGFFPAEYWQSADKRLRAGLKKIL